MLPFFFERFNFIITFDFLTLQFHFYFILIPLSKGKNNAFLIILKIFIGEGFTKGLAYSRENVCGELLSDEYSVKK